LEINERGTFEDPAKLSADDPVSKAKLVAQEEEIFQMARLINAGWFGMGMHQLAVSLFGSPSFIHFS
jgi:linoleate 10R-lipoxygenase